MKIALTVFVGFLGPQHRAPHESFCNACYPRNPWLNLAVSVRG